MHLLISGCLLVLAFMIRWYYLPENLFFGAEQGRDAIIAENIAQLKDFVLVGPQTDINGVFHGVWFYYALAIPYYLGQGNPLVASGTLIFLSSLVPVLMYGLFADVTRSRQWGTLAGLLTVISYEYITYSRWLSNVTPAVVMIVIFFWCLWRYRTTQRQRWFVAGVSAAVLGAQFEIILCLVFGFVIFMLLLTRWIKLPQWRTWLVVALMTGLWFSPMVLFNFRNEFITVKAVINYISGAETDSTSHAFNLSESLRTYGSKTHRLVKNTLIPIYDFRLILLEVGLVVGSGWVFWKQAEKRTLLFLCWLWVFMTLPVLVFTQSLALTQLYIGAGLGLIGVLVIVGQALWSTRSGKIWLAVMLLIIASGLPRIENNLRTNSDVLFKTVQDDLNYRDQLALLNYVAADAQGQPYRLQAFTIPYFREEGWQYLHRYLYPESTNRDAQLLYIIIEEKVDPFWEKKWIEEDGATKLVEERKFGLLRVQKRELL